MNSFSTANTTAVVGRMPNFCHLTSIAKLGNETPYVITEKKEELEPLI